MLPSRPCVPTSRGRPPAAAAAADPAPVLGNTYAAGILAMLLTADRSHTDWNRAHHDELAKGPKRDRGYWGYAPGGGGSWPNLSTTQFACLGLWAGERSGAPVATRAWRLHLDALLEAQHQDGSWGYSPGPPDGGDGGLLSPSYRTGTYMGLADLTLAAQAPRDELRDDPRLWSRTLLAAGIARGALRRHVAWDLESVALGDLFGNSFPCYRLYALEKVCVFVDLEDVAGRRWYEEGARRLIAQQCEDGSWVSCIANPTRGLRLSGDTVGTSFALLFLLRASHAYHPITPRPVDHRDLGITPGAGPVNPTVPPPEPPITALENAEDLLDQLEAWLAQRSLETPGPALDTLAVTDRRIAPRLMRTVEGLEGGEAIPLPVRVGWYSAAFDALRRLEAPALASWLVDRMISPQRALAARSSAALVTLGGIHGLRGVQRRAAIQGLFDRLTPLFKLKGRDATTRDLQIDALTAIRRLANQGDSDFPTLRAGHVHQLVETVRSWWLAHKAQSDPAWKD